MTVLQLLQKGMLGKNQLLKAKKTMVIAGCEIFKKGRLYRTTKVTADMMVVKGEAGNALVFDAKKGAKNLFSWTNFKLVGKNRKAKTRILAYQKAIG